MRSVVIQEGIDGQKVSAVSYAEGWQPKGGDPGPDRHSFKSGAVRSNDVDNVRYDLITPIGMRRLAETYHEGAVKYGDGNWLRGMEASNLVNHCLAHIFKYVNHQEPDVDHLAHAAWNLFALMEFEETRDDMQDLVIKKLREERARR